LYELAIITDVDQTNQGTGTQN